MIELLRRLFSPPRDETLEELKSRFGLEEKRATHPMIAGSAVPDVLVGRHFSRHFTLRRVGGYELIVGRLYPYVDFALRPATKSGSNALQNFPPEKASDIILPSPSLLERWELEMCGHDEVEFLGKQLRIPEIEEALLGLSDAVYAVAFYRLGVELSVSRKLATPTKIVSDMEQAFSIVDALEKCHTDEKSVRGSAFVYDESVASSTF